MSMQRIPQKDRRLFEHQAPWLVATALGILMSCGLVIPWVSGLLGPRLAFRGHSPMSVTLAITAVVLFTISAFYLLRKRLFQEEFSLLRASMQSWLWAHVYLALFGTWLILLHAGYSLFTLEITSGKLALFALLGSVGSGLLWRLVYAFVPRRAARAVGNYSEATSRAEAERLAVEIEKLAAGRSTRFHELKNWLMGTPLPRQEVERAQHSLPTEEQHAFWRLAILADMRHKALLRTHGQRRYLRILQGWRLLHVPLTALFVVLVPIHVVLAYHLPARLLGTGSIEGHSLGGFESAEACENCHARIVDQWRGSMHAGAMSRPTMIAQTNQDLLTTLKDAKGPDPKDLCINCHGPIGAALTSSSQLPLTSSAVYAAEEALLNEGVSCSVCHQYRGKSFPGQAALSSFKEGFLPGRTYFGPRKDPVPNSFHQSEFGEAFERPGELCQNCHSVNYDLNGDGKIEKGKDLVLQTIFEEWEHYRRKGNQASCVDCHMPISDAKRSAERAWIPFEQDYEGPERQVRDHTFIGADHRLDVPEAQDPHAPARRRLLESAASLALDARSIRRNGSTIGFDVSVANVGTGHRLPGGFSFQRQLWLEVQVLDDGGRVLASSGSLPSPSHDLCDVEMFTGLSNSIRQSTLGCDQPDLLLVNFQTILLDRIEPAKAADGRVELDELGHAKLAPAAGAKETFLQHFTGGAVARIRGFDNKPVPPLDPGEERSFSYRFELGKGSGAARELRVRLLFRALAPYFLRALGNGQPANEPPVAPLVENLRIDELARVSAVVPATN
jgi:hypothetical protein